MTIVIGSFEIESLLAAGAMGQVYKGRHRISSVPVAIKVIMGAEAGEAAYKSSFRQEVQATAHLEHPSIIQVYDYGLLPEHADTASDGQLQPGSPWVAMEFADGGTIKDAAPLTSWRAVCERLLEILDALAHAHARDIVHRDLKPANLLLCHEAGGRMRLKLTDFGLAHLITPDAAFRGRHDLAPQAGTPLYMSPEQFEGRWRDFGPWTDLYAVGCMAYEMLTGVPPYLGHTFMALAKAHLKDPLPTLRPRMSVPDGAIRWIERLLHKNHTRRFVHAADAAYALLSLIPVAEKAAALETSEMDLLLDPVDTGELVDDNMEDTVPEPTADVASVLSLHTFTHVRGADETRLYQSPVEEQGNPRPPLPEHWNEAANAARSIALSTVGLGVFEMREVPFVGREAERGLLWATLRRVHDVQRASIVVIRGDDGVGKSRLSEWFCRRASELGGATALRAHHDPLDGLFDGLTRMLEEHLRCEGLDREATFERLNSLARSGDLEGVDPADLAALTELMRPGMPGGPAPVHFATNAERVAVAQRTLQALAGARPLIVYLDNIQWSAMSLSLARALLSEREHPIPAVVLMTVQDDALHDRPLESELLNLMTNREGVNTLILAPLSDMEMDQLIHEALPLTDPLIEEVKARTLGNPQHAIQILDDWVQRDILLATDAGFALQQNPQDDVLPDDLYDLWSERLFQCLSEVSQSALALRCLELAAVLGFEVPRGEWRHAAHAAQLTFHDAAFDPLVARGFVDAWDGGWTFSTGVMRETLLRSAKEEGRLDALHQACAAMLDQRYPTPDLRILERRVIHLIHVKAGEPLREPLLRLASNAAELGHFDRAREFLGHYEVSFESDSGGFDAEGQRLRAMPVLALLFERQGMLREASRNANTAIEFAMREQLRPLEAEASLVMGRVSLQQGRTSEAQHSFEIAQHLGQVLGNDDLCARGHRGLAQLSSTQGNLERARQHLDKALKLASRASSEGLMSTLEVDRAMLNAPYQTPQEAASALNDVISLCHRIGSQYNEIRALGGLGDVARFNGDFDEAEALYTTGLRLSDERHGHRLHLRMQVALTQVERHRFNEAWQHIEGLKEQLEAERHVLAQVHLSYLMLPLFAQAERLTALREAIDDAARHGRRLKLINRDLARSAEIAGDILEALGERELADQVFALALIHWKGLGGVFEGQARDLERRMR